MKLRALPSLTNARPRHSVVRLLTLAAAVMAAFWMLGAYVDALNLSIRRGEALRESQRGGTAAQSSPLAHFSSNTRLARM